MNWKDRNHTKFFIKTLGCKVNQYESQAMREILLQSGYSECSSAEKADVYIINTCTVTHQADKESRYLIGLFHRINPRSKIIVTGCYVERDSEAIASLPGVSHILKNEEKSNIAEVLRNPTTENPACRQAGNNLEPKTDEHRQLSITGFKGHTKAFLKIQDGCDNFCSYCKVPLVRGSLYSKPIEDIVKEISNLTNNGFKEIILTGICLGAWGKGSTKGLLDVMKAIDAIPGNFRIRLSSIEPKYVTGDLIDFIGSNKRVCKHLHIPFQSGDDEILKKMNRPYSVRRLESIVDTVKAKIDGAAITTDILIGFPGESDEHFRNTVRFIKDIAPARTHLFTFSRREGTAAYTMEGVPKEDLVRKRYEILQAVAYDTSYHYRKTFLGKNVEVLVESKRDKAFGLLTGYSDTYIKVIFEGPDSIKGNIVPVTIREVGFAQTKGSLANSEALVVTP